MKTLLQARGITKLFPGVKALNSVDLDIEAGRVHILMGENGAGKSTLAKCLLGAYIPDEGELIFDGEPVHFKNANDAIRKGIVAVYQEFTLVPYLSVAQNIFLNREPRKKSGLIDKKKMEQKARELLDSLNCGYIHVKSVTKTLSVAEQQMVEIAKALSYRPRVIVFDEPTATLSEREISSLFDQIRKMKQAGIGIVYVSHRMQEFSQIGDEITILRDGEKIATVGIAEKTSDELVSMMVGREVSQVYLRRPNIQNEVALRTEKLCDRAGKVRDASIYVRKGEIVGLAGLVGAGRTELARLIFGIDPKASGKVLVYEAQTEGKSSPQRMVARGLGMVPEDRKRHGLALKDSVAWNMMAVSMKRYFPKMFISQKKMVEICRDYKEKLRVACPDVHQKCGNLSGGNQQKVVLAKWLSNEPEILIFDEPTRGIDVGAKMEIYELMDKLAAQGKTILMISSELPEVIGMSDRVYVMAEGSIINECIRGEDNFNAEDIGAMMLEVGGDRGEG